MPKNVTEIVVSENLCLGCGVCAGVCPADCLEMSMIKGKYRPVLVGDCLACNMCLLTCPFSDHETTRMELMAALYEGTPGIETREEVGFYLKAFVGYSTVDNQRKLGASGGMATWLLEQLLKSGEVEHVITLGSTSELGHPMFQYAIYDDIVQVRAAAGSKYYPTEVSAVLKTITKGAVDSTYAIVGLPCLLEGIRRAMGKVPRLARRIRVLLGLVCGHCPDSNYTDFLCALVNASSSDVRTVEYRLKGLNKANDYRFRALKSNGNWSDSIGFQGIPVYVWNNRYFGHKACSYCDDVFAEVADVVFMDAWLEDYIQDTSGNSLILVRNPRIAEIIEDGIQKDLCELTCCNIQTIIYSQKELVRRKKEDIRYRILERLNKGRWVPNTRLRLPQAFSRTDMRLARQEARTVCLSVALWRLLRWIPAGLLPFYCWLVDRMAGRSFRRPVATVLKRSLVQISKKARLYSMLKKLKRLAHKNVGL